MKDVIPLVPHAMECGDASNISINWMDLVAETRSVAGMYDLLLATSYSDHLIAFLLHYYPHGSGEKVAQKTGKLI